MITFTFWSPVRCLEIEFEVKVSLVKLMYSHISVLSATSVAFAVRVKLD